MPPPHRLKARARTTILCASQPYISSRNLEIRKGNETGKRLVSNGTPGAIRTPDPQIRSLVLYPAELRVPFSEGGHIQAHSARCKPNMCFVCAAPQGLHCTAYCAVLAIPVVFEIQSA